MSIVLGQVSYSVILSYSSLRLPTPEGLKKNSTPVGDVKSEKVKFPLPFWVLRGVGEN
jgi:hypothetical protein